MFKSCFITRFILALSFFANSTFKFSWADTSGTPPPAEEKKAEMSVQPEMSFEGEALVLKNLMVDLFENSKKVDSTVSSEKKVARGKIESALDWDEVAHLCLGDRQWNTQNSSNKTQFRNLLKGVVLKTAYGRISKFWGGGTQYQFKKIMANGSKGEVSSRFSVNQKFFSLDYYFIKKGNQWLIYDVSYDDIRYGSNIYDQIESFLKEMSFNQLLEKMKKRLDEISSHEKKKG